jgi:hypothetical protein
MSSSSKRKLSHDQQGKLNQNKEDQQDSIEIILGVTLENLIHQRNPKCPRYSSHHHLFRDLS